MKVAVIGGGSSYTPELVLGFLDRADTFPMTELCLMDISSQSLEIVGDFAQRMVRSKGTPFSICLTTDQRQAISGANYVITQLRVGGMSARREDEYLGRRHGLIGQETTGVGGMAKALRTIPTIFNIAEDIKETAPGALLVNFTNPAGLITEALYRYMPELLAVGVCNVPITTKMMLIEGLRRWQGLVIEPEKAELQTLGLNHLSWHYGFKVGGEDLWSQILDGYLRELEDESDPEWDIETIKALQMIANYYLQYYYYTDQRLATQEKWPPSRAEEVMGIEADLMRQYAEPDRSEPPETLMNRGGAYYSTVAAQLLNAHYNDLGENHIVNRAHEGAVPGWPGEWVLEMPCRVGSDGIVPLPSKPLPAVCFGLLAQVKSYEILATEAAVHGNRDAAYQALLAHPLGPPADRIQVVLDDLIETNQEHLPSIWF